MQPVLVINYNLSLSASSTSWPHAGSAALQWHLQPPAAHHISHRRRAVSGAVEVSA